MLSRFFSLSITPEIAIRAARIGTTLVSKGEEIGVNDTYIAAVAIVHDLTLVTADVAHFRRIEGLRPNITSFIGYDNMNLRHIAI